MERSIHVLTFDAIDLRLNRSLLVAIVDPPCVLCNEPRLCVPKASIVVRLHRDNGVLLCNRRSVSVSQHVWVGDIGRHVGLENQQSEGMAVVLPFPTFGDRLLLRICECHEKTLDGMGRLCAQVPFCCCILGH